ncbi:unnamed protein product [Notodromas monacha]|uniref:DNA-directed RNA polymerase II subunit RPB4 n=1 Tax=Notodromas monacha TaxID=399045 RepID=A0A7R9GA33_9CRUS|nr:unnamed protein product [Notodromas monacha]CAG0913698.1 unnamed protein product [Notodromas monacha]
MFRWDEWVPLERLRKSTPENLKLLAKDRGTGTSKAKKKSAKASGVAVAMDHASNHSRSSSRTSTPTPSTPIMQTSTSDYSAVPGQKRPHSAITAPHAENSPDTLGTPVAKKARRSTRSSMTSDASGKPESETSSPRSASGRTRSAVKSDVSDEGTPTMEGKTKEMKRPAAPVKSPGKPAKMSTSRIAKTYPFDGSRVDDVMLERMFPSRCLPFQVPKELQKVFVFDCKVYQENAWVPLVPAKRSVGEIITSFLQRSSKDELPSNVEGSFGSGLEAVFNDLLPETLLTEKEILVETEGNASKYYGIVHLLRLLCFLPSIMQICSPGNSGIAGIRKPLETFLRFIANNSSTYVAEDVQFVEATKTCAAHFPKGTTEEVEEDASELQFPKEFQNAETLLCSEVHMLLEHRKQQNENTEDEQELSEVFMKTFAYCQKFSKFKNRETIAAVRALLMQKKLHKFEVAALANLCPETPEEARGLIPSLEGRFEDEELRELLDDLQTKRSFQY